MANKFQNLIPVDSHTLYAEDEGNKIQGYDSNGRPVFLQGALDDVISWDATGNLVLIPNTASVAQTILTYSCPVLSGELGMDLPWNIMHGRSAGQPVLVQIVDKDGIIVYPHVTINTDSTVIVTFDTYIVGTNIAEGDFVAYIY